MTTGSLIVLAVICVAGVASYLSRKLTLLASIVGTVIAMLMHLATGWPSLLMLAAFFLLGTAVTSYKKSFKIRMGLSHQQDTRRNVGQVLANGGVAAFLSLMNIIDGNLMTDQLAQLMIAGSLAAATGDTLSSELGNIYGRNFYNIVTLRKDQRGLNGVISVEGTIAGIFGSAVIAGMFAVANGLSTSLFLIVMIAGVIGNLADSYLGAIFERRGLLGNDVVNFLNTTSGALVALGASHLTQNI